jgi:alpha-ribazole phosphatase
MRHPLIFSIFRSKPVRLIIIRHFNTRSNASGRIIGWGDSPPAPDWEKDLKIVCAALKHNQVDIDTVYSSDLQRAKRTAEYFAECKGPPGVIHSSQLNEVNYGELYLKSKHWVSENVPEYKTDPDYVFPCGESFRQMQMQMQTRSVAFIHSLEATHGGQTLLLVIHAGVVRSLVCHFLRLDYSQHLKCNISHRYIGDLSISAGRCIRYYEQGKPSDFVVNGSISPVAGQPDADRFPSDMVVKSVYLDLA